MIFISKPILTISWLSLRAGISSTAATLQLVSHPLYTSIDWNRVIQGEYAVVDPNDPHSILYLDATDYIVQTRVSMTSRKKLIVLATPQDKEPVTDYETSNPKGSPQEDNTSTGEGNEIPEHDTKFYRRSYKKWFGNPFKWVTRKKSESSESVGESRLSSMVLISEGNLWSVVGHWALQVHVRLQGLGSQRVTRREVYTYVKCLRRILRGRGLSYLIAYLKATLFVVNAFVGGQRLSNTWGLGIGIRLTNGLPAALPTSVRRAIRARSYTKIRLWVSIFYMYKAFWGRHKCPSLDNVQATPYNSDEPKNSEALANFAMWVGAHLKPLLEYTYGVEMSPDLKIRKPFLSSKAGPNFPLSLLGAFLDTCAWTFKYGLYTDQPAHNELVKYLEATGNNIMLERFKTLSRWCLSVWSYFEPNGDGGILERGLTPERVPLSERGWKIITDMTGILKPVVDGIFAKRFPVDVNPATYMVDYFGQWSIYNRALKLQLEGLRTCYGTGESLARFISSKINQKFNGYFHKLCLGKLSFILEPSGKVRTIAIVDWWTQTALIPMHEWLFTTLRKGFGDTDATFDQEGAVRRFASQGHKELYSYDLKSATDLIPQQLYLVVISAFVSKDVASAWMSLLTAREWITPYWSFKDKTGKVVQRRVTVNGSTKVRYTRGQPMGALSSWGALALIHHCIVRYAAYLVGETQFQNYLVLGDDIVIAGKNVADSYLTVCESLGITLSLQKSYMSSEGLFNFASQVVLGNTNISPLSFKKDLAMRDGFDRLTALLTSVPRGLVDFSTAGWLQQIARWVLPKSVYSDMEASRLKGVRHPVINVLGALLCGAAFSATPSAFKDALAEADILMPLRLILKPGLALFSLKLSELVQWDRRTEFQIHANRLFDRVEELLSTRYVIAREAFLKDVSRFFSPSVDGKSIYDREGDIEPSVTINFEYLVDVVTRDNISGLLPPGKLATINDGIILRMLTFPFLASFTGFFVDRMKVLYDDARLSREARERNKFLEGAWWEKGIKMDFGLESRLDTIQTLERDLGNLTLTPKIVLDMHEKKDGQMTDSVLDYLFLGLLSGRDDPQGFSDGSESSDVDFIPESSNAHKDKTNTKTSSSL